MPVRRKEPHATNVSWTASGTISLELSPKPYTITRLVVIARPSITTTTATWYNDFWDRIITRLNLTGGGKTYFDFTNMRAAYHFTRYGGHGAPRPTTVADSATTLVNQFMYVFHFGVAPFKVNPISGLLEDNPYDLTAGIPPVGSGNLSLGGSFGANSVCGSNVTVADCDLYVMLYGVQPEPGDPPEAYQPRALPVWSMQTPTPAATSSAFATEHNIPAGDFLHGLMVMLTNGSNAPRDDSVLNSIEFYSQAEARSIIKYGGQTGVVADVKVAELLTAFENRLARPYSDNVSTAMDAIASGGSPGVPTIAQGGVDSGLYYLPIYREGRAAGNPLFGADLRHVATGDYKLRYGVSDATGVTMDVVYRRYQLNPEHPANIGL